MKTEVMDVLLYIFERFQEDEFIPMDKAQNNRIFVFIILMSLNIYL